MLCAAPQRGDRTRSARLERIEVMLRAPASSLQEPPLQGTTWARMAAIGIRQAGEPHAILSTRYTVRIQLAQTKGIDNEEILKNIKRIISRTATIRVLYSSDIDIIILDKVFKNRAHGQLLTGNY
jgi:hypothetical protein